MLTQGIRRTGLVALAGAMALVLALALMTEVAGASKKVNLAPAKKALLVRKDLPSGWTSGKSGNDGGNSFPGESQLASCIGVPVKVLNVNPPSVNSPEFSNKAGNLMVDDNVTAFSSAKQANQQFAAIANPKTAGCYATLLNSTYKKKFETAFGSGATIGTITASGNVPAGYPAHTAALMLGFTVTTSGATIPFIDSEIFAVKGTLGHDIGFTSIGIPFPPSLSKQLTTTAVNRL